jgi:hypothetical protein
VWGRILGQIAMEDPRVDVEPHRGGLNDRVTEIRLGVGPTRCRRNRNGRAAVDCCRSSVSAGGRKSPYNVCEFAMRRRPPIRWSVRCDGDQCRGPDDVRDAAGNLVLTPESSSCPATIGEGSEQRLPDDRRFLDHPRQSGRGVGVNVLQRGVENLDFQAETRSCPLEQLRERG